MWPDLQYSQSTCLFSHFLQVRSYSLMFFIQVEQLGTEDIGKKDNLIFKDKHILKQTKNKHHLGVCAHSIHLSLSTPSSLTLRKWQVFSHHTCPSTLQSPPWKCTGYMAMWMATKVWWWGLHVIVYSHWGGEEKLSVFWFPGSTQDIKSQ